MISSYALSQRALVDWSPEVWPSDRYEGALVLPPKSGFYRDVHVMDVGAMYPNIMIDCNISIETVRSIDHAIRGWSQQNADAYALTQDQIRTSKALRETRVPWSDFAIVVVADGMMSLISRSKQGAVVNVLRHLIASRKAVRKSTPKGWAFKIATNSIYGALGASTSKLQCYQGAGAVTACGRVITSLASTVSEALGFEVIYGDTDLAFVSPKHHSSQVLGPSGLLTILHRILDFTPFGSIRLEHEKTYSSFISIKHKMYYGTKLSQSDVNIREVKGVAAARKDHIPII
uniref:DNA-directed DNA polymerase n=1 Tax=Ustilago esculenta TaxID=185366 RepID=A0A481SFF1_9BASI|nr:DNA polymerase [Ustilago esculenta]